MERASVYMDAPMLRGRAMAPRPGPPRGGRPVGTAGVAPCAAASLAMPEVPSSSAACATPQDTYYLSDLNLNSIPSS